MTLVYRGRPIELDLDLGYRSYIEGKKAADLTTDQIDALINTGLSGYADKTYVDTQDALLATKAYIDAKDNLRLKLANVGLANGIAGLDSVGRIPPQFINAPLTQRYVRGPWSPDSYLASSVDLTTETTLFVCNITDPGYPYRLMVFGGVDLRSNVEGEYGIINIRAGTPTGEIIATGLGSSAADDTVSPTLGDQFSLPTGTLPQGNGWAAAMLDGGLGGYLHSGGTLAWTDSGSTPHTILYRRTDPADALTATDYQRIATQIAVVGESPFGGGTQFIELVGRMNTSMDSYVAAYFDRSVCGLFYSVAGASAQMTNGVNGFVVSPANFTTTNTSAGVGLELLCGTYDGLRQFSVIRDGALVMSATDTAGVTRAGLNYRGWGFAGHADNRSGLGQTTPPALQYMLAGDAPPNSKMVSVIPVNSESMQVRTGSTTLYVRGVRSGASATIRAYNDIQPNLFPIAFPAGA